MVWFCPNNHWRSRLLRRLVQTTRWAMPKSQVSMEASPRNWKPLRSAMRKMSCTKSSRSADGPARRRAQRFTFASCWPTIASVESAAFADAPDVPDAMARRGFILVLIPLIVREARTLRENAHRGPPRPHGLGLQGGLLGRRHERLQRTLELRAVRESAPPTSSI